MRNFAALSIFVLTLLSAVLPAKALTLLASGDTYIQKNDANTNFGAATEMRLKQSASDDYDRAVFLQFDLSTVTQPFATASITLTFTQSNLQTNAVLRFYGINNGATDESFNENTLTFNNSTLEDAGSVTGINTASTDLTDLGTVTVPSFNVNGTTTFTSAALLNFLNADSNDIFSVVVVSESPYDLAFIAIAAEEHPTTAAPTLNYTVVPEAGPALLLGLAGLACLSRRSMRSV